MSSDKAFLSGVRSFFALLNTRSHSIDIAGQDKGIIRVRGAEVVEEERKTAASVR